MRRADEAMYEAKRLGKNRHVIFATAPKSDGTPWASLTHLRHMALQMCLVSYS